MFAELFHRVLQYRYDLTKLRADKAIHKLNKANIRFADAANALNEYEAKIFSYGNSRADTSETTSN